MGTKAARQQSNLPVQKFNRDFLTGVGSAIRYIATHEYHAASCKGCHTTANEMDKLTPEECLARIDEFAEKMHQNAKQRLWNRLLDAFATHEDRKELIRRGVQLHLDEVAKKTEYTTQQRG